MICMLSPSASRISRIGLIPSAISSDVIDWHWNAIGHALAAQEVARVIQRSSTPGPQSGIKTNTGD
jgi:hypothetical protein